MPAPITEGVVINLITFLTVIANGIFSWHQKKSIAEDQQATADKVDDIHAVVTSVGAQDARSQSYTQGIQTRQATLGVQKGSSDNQPKAGPGDSTK